MTHTTSETLNLAADLIEQRGWAAGGWEWERGGGLCIEGAILAAANLNYEEHGTHKCPAHKAVRAYLADRTSMPPFLWNDHLAHDRVLAAIERGETLRRSLDEVRDEANAAAASDVIEVLRACAVIEAVKENADTCTEAHA